ncbi:flagellar hook capping FlgD N-terminal domain-containing protein [Yoonia sp.]|uniref:flagellar hook capping FlgD N-terminal domain-containing protein n=1 Tax=Yoonia sp. TaxID=2212373 RepID=UPI0025E3A2B0|nr:flagellar hook capping FlgD N-terminal domain-containing protein [Yoonia sp.]
MEITQSPATAPSALPTAGADASLNSDFEVFLQMLTAQMKYQDPLNPVDSTDYATQLATFSGVEQAVLTNDLLKSLTTQMTVGGLSDMASWVGREARTSAPTYFDGKPIELFPQAIGAADTKEIIVRDESGAEVQRIPYASGSESIQWAGVQANGTPMQAGLYSFQIVGKANGDVTGQAGVDVYSKVNEASDRGRTDHADHARWCRRPKQPSDRAT